MKKNYYNTIFRHSLIWAIFIAYEMSYVYFASVSLSNFLDYALHYTVNIALFYINVEGFTYLFKNKINKYLGIVTLLIFEISIYLFIQFLLFKFFVLIHIPSRASDLNLKFFFIQGIYRAIYFIGFSVAYWFAIVVIRQRKLILELENTRLRQENVSVELKKDLIQVQNAYLLSQLNPHLLFNTLSFIYNSVKKLSEPAAEAILLLSDMMRYSLSGSEIDGKVPLKNEIDHIKDIVKLNQLRFNKKLHLKLHIKGKFESEVIAPLLLLSFIENVYKHGDLTNVEFPAEISISCENKVLLMTCKNKKNRSNFPQGWGIGIANTKSRLSNSYPDGFELNITDEDSEFKVFLRLNL